MTAPLGLPGELMMIARVRSVTAASMSAAFRCMPFSGRSATGTTVPPHSMMDELYEVKYGDGTITSSPEETTVLMARNRPMVPPSTAWISVSGS